MRTPIFNIFVFISFLAVLPASPNYKLDSLDINSGGGFGVSNNYTAETAVGEAVQTPNGQSANNKLGLGLLFTQQANAPTATLLNSGGFHNKLLLTLNTQNNATSTKYVVAISTDNFITTQYVQSDGTVGAVLGPEDIQTFAAWGGVGGSFIIALDPATIYYVKDAAQKGVSTQSPYGPVVSAATLNPTLSFDRDVAATDIETAAPYNIDMGTLPPNTVTAANNLLWFDVTTNAPLGASVFIKGNSNALTSVNGDVITSVTGNLSALASGYGLQLNTLNQASGGPLISETPYDGALNNVGAVTTTLSPIISSSLAINGARSSILVKAKVTSVTAASDTYTETITAVAVPNF